MNVSLASVWDRTRFVTRGAWVVLALSACGQSPSDNTQSANLSDTASAYLALSDKVEACEDEKDACVTDAAGDATKVAACEAAAESCIEKTREAQADARRRLRGDAEGCVRECRRNRGDSDGGTDEDGPMDTGGCMRRRGQVDNQCMDDFFVCLDATGVRMSGGSGDLDDATRAEIEKCLDTAHSCMMSDMRGRRPGRGDRGMRRGAAGEPAGAAGADGRRGPRAEAGDGADDDRRGPGRRGAAGGDPDRSRRRGGAGAGGN